MKKICNKCGFESEKNKLKFSKYVCDICLFFSPNEEDKFYKYLEEKINWKNLESYRKQNRLSGTRQKEGMNKKAQKGNVMSRAPFGYKIENNLLIPSENSYLVEEIFLDFQNTPVTLTKLSKKYGLSINGLKKVLRNFTYLGKIKFDGVLHEGSHKPLVSSTLFNHVQDKLERLGIKKS